MEKFKTYEKIILDYYQDFIDNYKSKNDPLEYKIISDKINMAYVLILIGWENEYKFVYSPLFHIEIKDKVILQKNSTEILIFDELQKRGIPKKDMWIGFNPDYANEYEGYGVDDKVMA